MSQRCPNRYVSSVKMSYFLVDFWWTKVWAKSKIRARCCCRLLFSLWPVPVLVCWCNNSITTACRSWSVSYQKKGLEYLTPALLKSFKRTSTSSVRFVRTERTEVRITSFQFIALKWVTGSESAWRWIQEGAIFLLLHIPAQLLGCSHSRKNLSRTYLISIASTNAKSLEG